MIKIKLPFFVYIWLALCTAISAEQVGPWKLDELKHQVPSVKWLRQDQPVHSLIYAGESRVDDGSIRFEVRERLQSDCHVDPDAIGSRPLEYALQLDS